MCSIGVTNISTSLLQSNQFSKKRGPDNTNLITYNNIQFLHNLLHLTGDRIIQPLIDNDVVVVFNGEIYNYNEFGEYQSDGQCIIDLYNQHGVSFVKHLDGEFAICLIDFKNDIILISTDTFACKPLWYEFQENYFCVGSYNSQLTELGFHNGIKLYANTTKVYSLSKLTLINQFQNFDFDTHQHKNTYDDWIQAFANSIHKRSANTQYGMYLGLSSGYDSGAIACELLNQKVDFKSYTIIGPENSNIINQRIQLIPNNEVIHLTKKEYDSTKSYITEHCENFSYKNYSIKGDKASFGLAAICRRAKQEKRRIYFSGQGADEIISDYGHNGRKIYGHSQFGGKFPTDLNGFWPWNSFYDGTQIQYLNKEEYIAGHYGIETRYPFLDKYLVQEFLWLDSKLKNNKYKSVLHEYLSRNRFPFAEEKIGFNTLKGLK